MNRVGRVAPVPGTPDIWVRLGGTVGLGLDQVFQGVPLALPVSCFLRYNRIMRQASRKQFL